MRIYKVEPNKRGYEKEIENTLEDIQKEVGGYIQICYLDNDLLAVVDEEGLLKDLPDNLWLPRYGAIKGNVIFVKDDNKGDFESLTDEQIETLKHWY